MVEKPFKPYRRPQQSPPPTYPPPPVINTHPPTPTRAVGRAAVHPWLYLPPPGQLPPLNPLPYQTDLTHTYSYIDPDPLPPWYRRTGSWIGNRPWWQLIPGIAVLLVVVMFTIAVIGDKPATDRDRPVVAIAIKEQGELARGKLQAGWVSQKQVAWQDAVISGDVLVAVECVNETQRSCTLRGRSPEDGRQLWAATDITVGDSLIDFGGTVLNHGYNVEDHDTEDQAHMTLINAADGKILREMPEGTLVARSATSLVFTEENEELTDTLIGVRASDGQEIWRHTQDVSIDISIDIEYEAPAGFKNDYEKPETYLLTGSGEIILEIDTGKEIARIPDAENQIAANIIDDILFLAPWSADSEENSDETSELKAYKVSDLTNSIWKTQVRYGRDSINACGQYICVGSLDKGKVLDPTTGKELIKNSKGSIHLKQLESMTVVHRCDISTVQKDGSSLILANPCPAHLAETEIVTGPDMKTLWRGGGLVFVTTVGAGDEGRIILGIADIKNDKTRILVASPKTGSVTEVGSITRMGLGVIPKPRKELRDAQLLMMFNLHCVADTKAIYCGTLKERDPVGQWRYSKVAS